MELPNLEWIFHGGAFIPSSTSAARILLQVIQIVVLAFC
jgi:hypothetical protein